MVKLGYFRFGKVSNWTRNFNFSYIFDYAKKKGFPLPTAKNGFHILNLHPKIYTLKKKKIFFNANLQKNLIIFTTQKLDATVKNRFQIFILHPKKHTIKKKRYFLCTYFYWTNSYQSFLIEILPPLFQEFWPIMHLDFILHLYSMWLSLVKSCTLWNINIYLHSNIK